MKKEAPLPFKAAGTDLGVVKMYSWERGPSPASLHAWIQNLYDVDSLSLCTLYVWHGPLYKDTNLETERVAYFKHRKDLQRSYSLVMKSIPIISQNLMRSTEIFIAELNGVLALLHNNKLVFQGQVFISHVFEIKISFTQRVLQIVSGQNDPEHFQKPFCT